MQPSTVLPKPTKPPRWWILVTAAAGAFGALAGIAAAGSGTYDVAPFRVQMKAKPALLGKTELRVRPDAQGLPGQPGIQTEAGTHKAPIVFRATIVGTSATPVATDLAKLAAPYSMATMLRDDGKEAITSFAIKVGVSALAGALAMGVVIGVRRPRRIFGALLAGFLTVAVIGVLVQQTYDIEEFRKPSFTTVGGEETCPGGVQPVNGVCL